MAVSRDQVNRAPEKSEYVELPMSIPGVQELLGPLAPGTSVLLTGVQEENIDVDIKDADEIPVSLVRGAVGDAVFDANLVSLEDAESDEEKVHDPGSEPPRKFVKILTEKGVPITTEDSTFIIAEALPEDASADGTGSGEDNTEGA